MEECFPQGRKMSKLLIPRKGHGRLRRTGKNGAWVAVVRGAPPPNAHLRPEAAGAGRGFPNCVPTCKSGPTRGSMLLPYALTEDGAPSSPPDQQPPSALWAPLDHQRCPCHAGKAGSEHGTCFHLSGLFPGAQIHFVGFQGGWEGSNTTKWPQDGTKEKPLPHAPGPAGHTCRWVWLCGPAPPWSR